MTFDENIDRACAIREEYPERPSEEQWDELFRRLEELGPIGGVGERWRLQRARQRLEAEPTE